MSQEANVAYVTAARVEWSTEETGKHVLDEDKAKQDVKNNEKQVDLMIQLREVLKQEIDVKVTDYCKNSYNTEVDCKVGNLYFPRARLDLNMENSHLTLDAFLELHNKGDYQPLPREYVNTSGFSGYTIGLMKGCDVMVGKKTFKMDFIITGLSYKYFAPSLTLGRDFVFKSDSCVHGFNELLYFKYGSMVELDYFTRKEKNEEPMRDFVVFPNEEGIMRASKDEFKWWKSSDDQESEEEECYCFSNTLGGDEKEEEEEYGIKKDVFGFKDYNDSQEDSEGSNRERDYDGWNGNEDEEDDISQPWKNYNGEDYLDMEESMTKNDMEFWNSKGFYWYKKKSSSKMKKKKKKMIKRKSKKEKKVYEEENEEVEKKEFEEFKKMFKREGK